MSDSSNSNPSAAGDPSGAPSNPIVLESDSAGDNTTSTEGAEEDKKLSSDDLFIQNEATTEDIVFLPLENGEQKKKSSKKGPSLKDMTTIDGIRRKDKTIICVTDVKVSCLRKFCNKNNIFNPKNGKAMWNESKALLLGSIENHIRKTQLGEDPYKDFPNLASAKKAGKQSSAAASSSKSPQPTYVALLLFVVV